MRFIPAIKQCFVHMYFNGRASRSEYWWFILFCNVVYVLLYILKEVANDVSEMSGIIEIKLIIEIPITIFIMVTFWSYIAVTVRRLHDVDKSGWLFFIVLPISLIVVIGSFILANIVPNGLIVLFFLIVIFVICSDVFFLILLMLKGTDGDNRFGPDPLQTISQENIISKLQPVTRAPTEPEPILELKKVTILREVAEQGNAEAQFGLGISYKSGDGVEQDDTKAVYWCRKAAEQGYAPAQYNLGACYDNGHGVAIDQSRAIYWYQKAAKQGDTTAQDNLRRRGLTW